MTLNIRCLRRHGSCCCSWSSLRCLLLRTLLNWLFKSVGISSAASLRRSCLGCAFLNGNVPSVRRKFVHRVEGFSSRGGCWWCSRRRAQTKIRRKRSPCARFHLLSFDRPVAALFLG